MMRLIATWLSERVAHFLWGRENATVPGLTPSSVSMVNTKCCPGPVLTSIWGQDYKYKQSSSHLINKSMSDLFIKIPGVDNGPVGHGERVTGALGHLHPPARHPDTGWFSEKWCPVTQRYWDQNLILSDCIIMILLHQIINTSCIMQIGDNSFLWPI